MGTTGGSRLTVLIRNCRRRRARARAVRTEVNLFDRELFFQLVRGCQLSWAAFPGRKGASRDSRELGSLTCVRAESPWCTEILSVDDSEVTARSTDDGIRVGGWLLTQVFRVGCVTGQHE